MLFARVFIYNYMCSKKFYKPLIFNYYKLTLYLLQINDIRMFKRKYIEITIRIIEKICIFVSNLYIFIYKYLFVLNFVSDKKFTTLFKKNYEI